MNVENGWVLPITDDVATSNEPMATIQAKVCAGGASAGSPSAQGVPDDSRQTLEQFSVRDVIDRINQIQQRINRKRKWWRVLFAACWVSVAFVSALLVAFMAAAELHPVAIFGAIVVEAVAILSLPWSLHIAIHACDIDDALCEKAKGSLTLLETRFRSSNAGSYRLFQGACDIVLQELLGGVVGPSGFGVRLPPMPESPVTDQILALLGAIGQKVGKS